MNQYRRKGPANPAAASPASPSKLIIGFAVVVGLAFCGLVVSRLFLPAPAPAKGSEIAIERGSRSHSRPNGILGIRSPSPRVSSEGDASTDDATRSAPQELKTLPETALPAQQLIAKIAQMDLRRGPLKPEQADELKAKLKELIQQGPAGLPAIQAFLEQHEDISFGREGGKLVGAASLRAGLLEALKEIGGPEALDISRQVLKDTSDAHEIATIARNLEAVEPGQHRQEILDATRQTLSRVTDNEAGDKEVGPLFQMLQSYGDANVVNDLEKLAPKWNYYASLALAGLPDGKGVTSLTRLAGGTAEGGAAAREVALEVLAQISTQNPEASSSLLSLAQQKKIPDSAWNSIAEGLGGNQIQFNNEVAGDSGAQGLGVTYHHMVGGNQTFYSVPAAAVLSEDLRNQRIAVIDSLLAMASSQAAVEVLQNVRSTLNSAKPGN